MSDDLAALRERVRPLLRTNAPGDGLAVYYALYHDPSRTQLAVHEGHDKSVDGFVAVCVTGLNLFQPIVVLRAPDVETAGELLQEALLPGRPYYVTTLPSLAPALLAVAELEAPENNIVHTIRQSHFRPILNVMVTREQTPAGEPRFVIRSRNKEIISEAGVNWRSPHYAEVYVNTRPAARGRGLGKSVLSALTNDLFARSVSPLYIAASDNLPSLRLARSVGYADSGAREFAATVVRHAGG